MLGKIETAARRAENGEQPAGHASLERTRQVDMTIRRTIEEGTDRIGHARHDEPPEHIIMPVENPDWVSHSLLSP
ncbi:hypothetical protein D9M68_976450 [compost metagenome]